VTTSSVVRSFNAAYQENRMMSSALARGRARVHGALTTTPAGARRALLVLPLSFVALVAPAVATEAHASPGKSPDGTRVYEQVSPVDKSGYDGFAVGFYGPTAPYIFQNVVSRDAQAITFGSNGPFSGAPIGAGNQYLARRSATGWTSEPITPPLQIPNVLNEVGSPRMIGASDDLGRIVFGVKYVAGESGKRPNGNVVELSTRAADGAHGLFSLGSLGASGLDQTVKYDDISPDGRYALFTAAGPLEPGVPDGVSVLYARDLVRQRTVVVSELPDGTLAPSPQLGTATVASALLRGNFGGGTRAFMADQHLPGAISRDGQRIVFSYVTQVTAPNDEFPHDQDRLLLRVDGVRTLDVGANQRGTPTDVLNRGAVFQWMTPDGAHVFFTSDGQLTDDAPATVALYRYDVNAAGTGGTLHLVSGDADVDVNGGFVGASDDGSIAYFVTQSQLGGEGAEGGPNLFASTPDGIKLVAILDPSDMVVRQTTEYFSESVWRVDAWIDQQARVSPDGRHLLFQSAAPVAPGTVAGQTNVFRYELGGEVACVSCGAPGPTGTARLSYSDNTAVSRAPRNITDDGSLVYFETDRGLDAHDHNGRFDVYEWNNGHRELVTSGTSSNDAYFVDAGGDGKDVFVLSYAQLAASDTDTAGDIYDARVGGGFPAANGGLEDPVPCAGEDCRPIGSTSPGGAVPGSALVEGSGNVGSAGPSVPNPVGHAVKITRARSSTRLITLTVSVPGEGVITTSGAGTKSTRRTSTRATTYTVRVPLSKAGAEKAARARGGKASFRVRVRFVPSGGQATSATTRISVRG
jgi:hypothetical protein